ncbi:hypothetical protein DNX30_14705 [Escherichia coli]|uniref:Uncharacterized protein n=2 Tax=Enterobacteriaceae TaxID=543 RepID=A0A1X0PG92_ECOLX|nr:hypothetical protein BUE82_00135 [Escherichia coli]EFO2217594.1 hypothetical protein [Escherichia coli O11]OYE45111.1 hypothetical protein CI633_27530 [Shigella sonnei]OYK66322.1 hypothetical protein CI719_27380 [Shigella boydii]PUE84976.1 hypothetical protein DBP04_21665 [Escherichia sp. R8]
MLLFFTIIFQGGILFHYLVKDRMVSVLKIIEHISIIALYHRKYVFQTCVIYFVTNKSKISRVIYESISQYI